MVNVPPLAPLEMTVPTQDSQPFAQPGSREESPLLIRLPQKLRRKLEFSTVLNTDFSLPSDAATMEVSTKKTQPRKGAPASVTTTQSLDLEILPPGWRQKLLSKPQEGTGPCRSSSSSAATMSKVPVGTQDPIALTQPSEDERLLIHLPLKLRRKGLHRLNKTRKASTEPPLDALDATKVKLTIAPSLRKFSKAKGSAPTLRAQPKKSTTTLRTSKKRKRDEEDANPVIAPLGSIENTQGSRTTSTPPLIIRLPAASLACKPPNTLPDSPGPGINDLPIYLTTTIPISEDAIPRIKARRLLKSLPPTRRSARIRGEPSL